MATYFISPQGNDSLDGKSKTNAWKSIHRLNQTKLQPGDEVLLETGGIWNQILNPSTEGLTIGAFGDSSKLPIITGELELTNWTSEGNGIWSITNPNFTNLQLLTIDGKTQPKGRFPKNKFLRVDASSPPKTNMEVEIYSNELDENLNFQGAEIIIDEVSWIQNKGWVIWQNGKSLSYNDYSTNYYAKVGWGFFFQNHPLCLSDFGDWYFDSNAKKIYFYFGAEKPTNYTIKVSHRPKTVDIRKDNIKLSHLDLRYGASELVAISNAKNSIIESCQIRYGALYGIKHYDTGGFSDNALIEACTIEDTYDHAISALNSIGIAVLRNTIRRNFIHPGTAGNDDLHGSTISLGINNYRGGNYRVLDNLIEDSGYDAIHFSMSNVEIANNTVRRACMTKVDGGGIYCFGGGSEYTNRKIIGNKIIDILPISSPNGYNAKEQFGIYLDGGTENVLVENNEIQNVPTGIYLNNAKLNTVKSNRIKDTSDSGILIRSGGTAQPSTQNQITGNLIESDQGVMMQIITDNHLKDLGTINGNEYIKTNGGHLIDVNYGAQKYSNLKDWTAATGYDKDSIHTKTKPDPKPEPPVDEPDETPIEEPKPEPPKQVLSIEIIGEIRINGKTLEELGIKL